jgi:hypothetical protein
VGIFGISFAGELVECLTTLKFDVDRAKLQKYLLLLERLELIKKTPRSNQLYYLSRSSTPFISLAFIRGTKIRDRDRLRTLIRGSLAVGDERRMTVYRNDLDEQSKRRP